MSNIREKEILPDELYTAEALGHLGHVGLLAMPPLVDLGLNLGVNLDLNLKDARRVSEGEDGAGGPQATPSAVGSGGGLPGLLVEDDGEVGEGLVGDTVDPSEGSQCLSWGRSSWARQRQACRRNGGHEDNYGERQG